VKLDRSVLPVPGIRGGTTEAPARLKRFVRERHRGYASNRNHPEPDATSLKVDLGIDTSKPAILASRAAKEIEIVASNSLRVPRVIEAARLGFGERP